MLSRTSAVINPRSPAMRAGTLLALGAYAVHELRYAITFGGGTSHVLEDHGHSYMSALVPVLGLLLAVALGSWVMAIVRAHRDRVGEPERRGFSAAWLAASASMFGIFALQETIEGLVAPGHMGGAAAVFGAGGWTALPLALVVGAVVVLLLRGARAATRRVASSSFARPWRPLAPPLAFAGAYTGVEVCVRHRALAGNCADRAPPAIS